MLIYKGKAIRNLLKFVSHSFSTAYNTNKDYYKILSIDKTASDSEIKAAYYKLAKKYHPDHNKGNEAQFKQINQAYSVLSDSSAKREYQNARNNYSQSTTQNPYSSYGQNNNQYYHDPFENIRNQYYQRSSYQNNNSQYNQWQGGQWQQWQGQQSNRNQYQNPYEAYDKFRQQTEYLRKQRERMRQQQADYMRSHTNNQQFTQEDFYRAQKVVRLAFVVAILTAFFLFAYQPRNNYYVDPNSPQQYRMVSINGTPYMQREQDMQNYGLYGNPYQNARY